MAQNTIAIPIIESTSILPDNYNSYWRMMHIFLQGRMWSALMARVSSGMIRVGWSPAAEALASWHLSALTAHPEDGLLLFLH